MCLQDTAKARRAIQQSNQGHRPWIGDAINKKPERLYLEPYSCSHNKDHQEQKNMGATVMESWPYPSNMQS